MAGVILIGLLSGIMGLAAGEQQDRPPGVASGATPIEEAITRMILVDLKGRPTRDSGKINLEIGETPVSELARIISPLLGKKVLYPEVMGERQLSIQFPAPAQPKEVIPAIRTALQGVGLDLVEEGDTLRIQARDSPPAKTLTVPDGSARNLVVKNAPDNYGLSRDKIDEFRNTLVGWSKKVRLVPEEKGGNVEGLKIIMLRPGSVFERVGIPNGAVLTAINGEDLSLPEVAVQAFVSAWSAVEIKAEFAWRGKKKTITLLTSPRAVGQRISEPTRPAEPESDTANTWTGITKLSDTSYSIQRAELDRLLANLNLIAREARIIPYFVDGKSKGFKLFAIRPKSFYARIGIRNGDVIEKINDFPLDNPEQALEIYQKMKAASRVEITILRAGQSLKLTYLIE